MDKFLPLTDELSKKLQQNGEVLLHKLRALDVDGLDIDPFCRDYFKASHKNRLFFSIQTSAHILYRGIKLTKKDIGDIRVLDYGAGLGTLFLLAKMIGIHTVVYNDLLPTWKDAAEKISNAIDVPLDDLIVGDIRETLQILKEKSINCDLILSRNVVEHIYKLKDFYGEISRLQPQAIVFSSTTANIYNPASYVKHQLEHSRCEKMYLPRRLEIIQQLNPTIDKTYATKLAKRTRGLAENELKLAIRDNVSNKSLPNPSEFRSNTCDPDTGVWAEHLMSFDEYREQIPLSHYEVEFGPGFWDTHYTSAAKNQGMKMLNSIIKFFGKAGVLFSPFIYVIAIPKNRK